MADDDLWHVRMAADDVKELTLEQLDDLFRLDLIEPSTLVWQPGMTEWLPLSVVAGLDDPQPEHVSIPVSAPPPAPSARVVPTATGWPPRVETTASSWPPVVTAAPARATSPAPAAPPAAWSSSQPRPAPISPFVSTVAEPVAAPAAASVAPPSVAPAPIVSEPLTSVPPVAAFSGLPARTERRAGSWIVLLAFAAGAAVTLYRNDLVHAAARSVGQEGAYLKLETALGGPSFGTPRAVEEMAAAAQALAPAEAPTLPAAAPAPAPSAEPSATSSAEPVKMAESSAEDAPHHGAPAATSRSPRRSAPSPRPARRHVAPPSHATPVFNAPKKKSKGSEFDPLNPSL